MENHYGGYDRQPFVADFYDVTYNRREDTDVPFYTGLAKASGGRTLELACGTGRILIPIARAGCTITGLDLSPYMLAKCREKLIREPADIQKGVDLVQANMAEFSLSKKYDLITIPFRAFQHLLSVEEQKGCLKCACKHLTQRGRLVFDVFQVLPHRLTVTPEALQERRDFPEFVMPDGRKVSRFSRIPGYHRELQYNDIELIYYVIHPDGRQERLVDAFPMRYFFRYEVEHLLELCGLKVVDLFGNFDKSAFTADSPEMIFIAGKK